MTHALLTLLLSLSAPVLAANAVVDLCAPCSIGAHCMSNKCLLDANNVGLCSQVCAANTDCPTSFTCNASLGMCQPNTAATCPSPYPTPLNQLCQIPPINGNANTLLQRDCAAGLACYTFLPDSTGYALGVCVEQCSTLSNSAVCPFGDTCCFGNTADGSCVSTISSDATLGGCFFLGDVGDSCADGNRSYCLPGATCMYTTSPSAARCYDVCDQGLCNEGGTCQSVNGVDVCCDKSRFVANDIDSCVPAPGYCRRETGVRCDKNEQCKKGFCLKSGTMAACSEPCVSDSDCQAPSTDVNGDGTADGGSTCRSYGQQKYCWPTNGPVAAPACASIAQERSSLLRGSGCTCRSSEGAAVGLGALALLAVRSVRRRRDAGR